MNAVDMNLSHMDSSKPFEQRADELISLMTLEEKASQLLHRSKAVPRLGIPEYDWWNECLHGVARSGKATVFPQAIALAATFDADFVGRVATAISDEVRAKHHGAAQAGNRGRYAGLTCWTPNINIFRDPRWGRGHETYGEDPYLTGEIGAAFVKGLQGDHPKYLKVAACAKHYAVHSGPEAKRHEFDAQVSGKDLHETYLPAFKRLVEAGVEIVMGAYNRVNGEPACAHGVLMDLLRKQWGFQGHFVSDCWAVRDFHEHHKITSKPTESVKLALEKGCDLNCGCTYEHVVQAVKEGLLDEKFIDASLKRLLMTRFKLGMFDPPEQVPYASISLDVVNCAEHRQLARQAAQKSIVLLKNDQNVLPLAHDAQRILITGHNAASVDALLGNYYGMNGRLVTVLEGVAEKVGAQATVEYHPGCLMDRYNPNAGWINFGGFQEFDLIVAVVGLSGFYEGEESDALLSTTVGDRESIALPQNQVDFLQAMFDYGKPVVVVVMAGSAIDLSPIVDQAAAILWAWYPGEEGGNAVADVLFGDVAPAGRLPVTFPKASQLQNFDNYDMQGRTYRFMEEKPLFPFGYGLSYTEFEYSQLQLRLEGDRTNSPVLASVAVTNIGDCDGDEVVQVYIKNAKDDAQAPFLQLAGFKRVTIGKDQTLQVTFELNRDQFCSYDADGKRQEAAGSYHVYVGSCQPGFGRPGVEGSISI